MAVPDILNSIRNIGTSFIRKTAVESTHSEETEQVLNMRPRVLCDIADLQQSFNTRQLLTGRKRIDIAESWIRE